MEKKHSEKEKTSLDSPSPKFEEIPDEISHIYKDY